MKTFAIGPKNNKEPATKVKVYKHVALGPKTAY